MIKKLFRHPIGAVSLLLFLLLIIASILSPSFRTIANMSNVLRQAVALGLVSLGQSYVMYSGGFLDLSVGSTMSLVSVLAALAMGSGFVPPLLVVFFLVIMGIVIGIFNGLIILKLKLHPFIATFATMSILQGIVFMITTSPTGYVSGLFRKIATANWGPLPVGMIILLGLFGITYFILNYTQYGRSIYTVGGNTEIARLVGVKTDRIRISVYVIAGLGAVLAGLFMTSRLGIGSPVVGNNYGFDSITTVVLGGAPLGGGRGHILGTLIGVFILVLINNVLNMIEVPAYWQYIIKAIILLGAVGIQYKNRS